MRLEISVVEGTESVVVRLAGELDVSGIARAREALKPYLTNSRTVIANVAELSFVDSAGLSVFMECRNTARASGSRFWVEGAQGEVAMLDGAHLRGGHALQAIRVGPGPHTRSGERPG